MSPTRKEKKVLKWSNKKAKKFPGFDHWEVMSGLWESSIRGEGETSPSQERKTGQEGAAGGVDHSSEEPCDTGGGVWWRQ